MAFLGAPHPEKGGEEEKSTVNCILQRVLLLHPHALLSLLFVLAFVCSSCIGILYRYSSVLQHPPKWPVLDAITPVGADPLSPPQATTAKVVAPRFRYERSCGGRIS